MINAIRKEEVDKGVLAGLSYHDHLWLEREIKTVANITHYDIQEFLPLAAKLLLRPAITAYRLEDANQALLELKRGQIQGAKVLLVNERDSQSFSATDTRAHNV